MIKFFRRKRKPKKTIEEVLECITEDTLSEEDRKDEHKVQHYVLGHFEIIYTPGHKSDSISIYFYEYNFMFTGDFLFKGYPDY